MRTFSALLSALWILTCILFTITLAQARTAVDFDPGTWQDIRENASPEANRRSTDLYPIQWPSNVGALKTSKLATSFGDNGTFGRNMLSSSAAFASSFETPLSSEIEYLFGGGIWIGAIKGTDTLVSVGCDGWNSIYELGRENFRNPAVNRAWFPSDYSLRTEFTDTVEYGATSEAPHQPIGIHIALRAYIWNSDPFDNAVFYDMILTNIRPTAISDCYIGLYMDADIYYDPANEGSDDDVAGSIRDSAIAYAIDNDGDPTGGIFSPTSPTKVFALRYLASSFEPADTNFNWWISNSEPTLDFGPRMRGSLEDPFRDFGANRLGTPDGDRNKYYVLRHREWDYNQVYTAAIDSADTVWLYPDSLYSADLADGLDTRFLMSLGPVNLEAGESHRIIFALFTADSVHTDPENISFLPDNPGLYEAGINLEGIAKIGAAAKTALATILDPLSPPLGLKIDGFQATWDPWLFDDVTGYEIYLTPVDPAGLPFPGVVPPWYRPAEPVRIATAEVNSYLIPDDAVAGLAAVNVAHNSASGTGQLSGSEFINIPKPATPEVLPRIFVYAEGPVTISWPRPEYGAEPDYYRIFKTGSAGGYDSSYIAPFYLEGWSNELYVKDSILVDGTWWYYHASNEPYATVPGDDTSFVDSSFVDGYTYRIVAVDANGFESEPAITSVHLVPERTRDILVITNSSLMAWPAVDTIRLFYETALADVDFEFLDVSECKQLNDWVSDSCPVWTNLFEYRLVLVDDNLLDMFPIHPSQQDALLNYVRGGGRLVYFGGLGVDLGTQPGWYPGESWRYLFGIDSVFQVGAWYSFPDGELDPTLFGFQSAVSTDVSYPSMTTDTARYPLDTMFTTFGWPDNQPPSVSIFAPSDGAEITHIYRSLYPETSLMEGGAVGVRYQWTDTYGSHETKAFGFHLYYMKPQEARDLILSLLPTDVHDSDDNLPDEFTLSQNYPNPFNPMTMIDFDLPGKSHVRIDVYNVLGQRVTTLVDADLAAGSHSVSWDAGEYSSGVYFYRIKAGDFVESKKMLLIK